MGIAGSFLQEVEFLKGDAVRQHHHRFQTEVFYALDEAPFRDKRPGPDDEARRYPAVCEPGGHPREPGHPRMISGYWS